MWRWRLRPVGQLTACRFAGCRGRDERAANSHPTTSDAVAESTLVTFHLVA